MDQKNPLAVTGLIVIHPSHGKYTITVQNGFKGAKDTSKPAATFQLFVAALFLRRIKMEDIRIGRGMVV